MSTLTFFQFFQGCVRLLIHVTLHNGTYNQAIAYTITPKEILLALLYIFGAQMFSVFPEVPKI